ncbi:MAG: DUF5991 domain-containing protein [Firmicutes bacterium]|nr:DUF5991 domain-containing protein [Bacillota bacterium]
MKTPKKLIICLILVFCICAIIVSCLKLGSYKKTINCDMLKDEDNVSGTTTSNLDSWINIYGFEEFCPPNLFMYYSIDLKKDSHGYYAIIYIDGFQTLKRLRANVLGDKNKIEFVFEKYLPDNMFELYKPGDILLRFEKEEDRLITHWNKLEPMIPTNTKSGAHFFITESTHLKRDGIWHSYMLKKDG